MFDYHVHLWPHGAELTAPSLTQIEAYAGRANELGIDRIAITEHVHRFVQVDALAHGFWNRFGTPELASATEKAWLAETGADLDAYCTTLQAAQTAGLPVEMGLEVDYLPGLVGPLCELLDQYPLDVRLGSVHWLGAWLFDDYDNEAVADEWDHCRVEDAWDRYADAVGELAEAGLCDVIAHADLIKVAGRYPDAGFRRDFEDRLTETLATSGLAVEVSSAGWRKPADEPYPSPSMLASLVEQAVPITLGSDAHIIDHIGWAYDRLTDVAINAGVTELVRFEAGRLSSVPFPGEQLTTDR